MTRNTLFASVIALGAAGAAIGAAPSALADEGTDPPIASVVPDAAGHLRGSVVGGGFARFAGGGESAQIVYADPGVGQRAPGIPVFVGGGESAQVVYLPPGADAAATVAAGSGIDAAGSLAAAAGRAGAAATRMAGAARGAATVVR
jgi:hypothetical protein